MSKINFEEDVANIDQESLESVSSLLQQQLIMENEVEMAELELKNKKDKLKKIIRRNYTCKNDRAWYVIYYNGRWIKG